MPSSAILMRFTNFLSFDSFKIRATGSRNKKHVLDGKEDKILNDFNNGIKIPEIAKKYKASQSSVYRFLFSNKPPFD